MTDVRDPRTGALERELRAPDAGQLAAAAAGLRAAVPQWQGTGFAGRATALRAWADLVEADPGPLTAALVADTGRRTESLMELASVVGMARRWADTAEALLAPVEATASIPTIGLHTVSRPYDLVGVISPWNFPLLLGLIDALPALAAGATVLAKPSEVTPRFVGPLQASFDAVPELRDAIRVVEGDGATGAALVHLVDLVCFTGSVPTGRAVGAAAAGAFIPAFLELGGKDPAVVLPGADLDRASSALLWGGTANAGQSCLSIERVYVDTDHHDELVDLLVAKAEKVRLAWPGLDDGEIGPLIDPAQAAVIDAHLRDAVAKGARVRTGGALERHGGGWWLRPTVVTGVDHGMLLMREETFGPVLPVMAYDTVDRAVELANDSDYGLSGAVFGPAEQAQQVASRLAVGAVSVNDAGLTAFVHDGEKNSFRHSGLGGSRMGTASIRRFVRKQTVMTNDATGPDPWWYQS